MTLFGGEMEYLILNLSMNVFYLNFLDKEIHKVLIISPA